MHCMTFSGAFEPVSETSQSRQFCCSFRERALTSSLNQVGDITGADFTDALLRKDIVKSLCKRPDAAGTNPTTGVDTRDSLLCDMF